MAQIRMLKSFKGYAEDSLQDFGSTENARLVSIGFASNDLDGPDGEAVQDRANLAAELAALYLLTSGGWSKAPSIFRLRLTGTGSVVIDSRDKLGAIASNIATYVLSSATNQIEFPYLGDSASDIRATFGPGITVEIL